MIDPRMNTNLHEEDKSEMRSEFLRVHSCSFVDKESFIIFVSSVFICVHLWLIFTAPSAEVAGFEWGILSKQPQHRDELRAVVRAVRHQMKDLHDPPILVQQFRR